MRKRIWIAVFLLLLVGTACKKEVHPDFLIDSGQVGKLSRTHRYEELKQVFEADSLVADTTNTGFGTPAKKLKLFEKGGKPLLLLTLSEDSLERVENIRILDNRYLTREGIGLGSTFGEIRSKYPVRKVVTSMNNVVIFIKGQDFYFTISREQLPASLRYAQGISVEEVQIPDQARVKYLMVGWDE